MRITALLLFLLVLPFQVFSVIYDWPVWRYDHNRSASTPEQLAKSLFLQWTVRYSPREPVWDDPLNQNLMPFDRIFEPIVADNKLFVGFNDQDKIVALDLNTGSELWHFYADGPVRMPLAAWQGRIFFTGDDGFCHCLDANTGSLVWKRLLAPAGNKLLGNKRLISMWPARGGIVLKDGILYTAASIFPMMGTFIYALDAATGDVIWKNEGTGSNYILQPHKSPAFADVAPQGVFTISGHKLLVAGGRSVPAAFDLKTGEELYYQLAASGKTGGAFTCANDKVFFNHHRERATVMYDSETGDKIRQAGDYPVIDGETFYFSGSKVTAATLGENKRFDTIWSVPVSATNDLIKAGDCLYAADSTGIKALKMAPGKAPEVIWNFPVAGNVSRLLAANGKLIAVTDEGSILVFGDKPVARVTDVTKKSILPSLKPGKTGKLIREAGISDGFSLVLGSHNLPLIRSLLSETELTVVVYEKEADRIQYLRDYFDRGGVKSGRLSFLPFEGTFPVLPKYFSSLTLVTDADYLSGGDEDVLSQLYETTRPYGGKIILTMKEGERKHLLDLFGRLKLSGATLAEGDLFSSVTRTGPLDGSSLWTHNYGNIANTVKSDDELVKAPLGILWFGGNSNMDVLPRHGHGPGEQVVDGRLIIQGINSLSARDVYTGRVLWKREFERLKNDTWLVYYDESYDEENPLDTKYNQVHLPGANARGTNFIATREFVYLIEGNKCNLIDIKTGDIARVFTTNDDSTSELGYIGVYDDLLILGNNFSEYPGMENDSVILKNPKFSDYNLTASRELFVLNRFTGERLWSAAANHGFIHNSVIAGDGLIFCLDKLPQYLETKLKRRGEEQPAGSRMLYFDARSGKVIHEETRDIFGTWLGYSDQYKLLLQATRPSRDMLNGESGNRMIAYDVQTKQKVWDKEMKYANPPILHNDKIYTNGEGFSLLTGDPLLEKDPVTGEELKWSFKREYGCGIVAASEYLLTFRSASAGFINLEAFEGTGSLGGWKAGCSVNLIAADGVLNSPDYTRTCQCPYQNQTSLALVSMPWMSYWTNSNYKWDGKPVRQLGLNFNAPGDRSSDEKVLWFEYPFVAGTSPDIPVKMDTSGFVRIRKEPFSIQSDKTPWVSASAIGGIRSLDITLSKEEPVVETSYTVRLHFAELEIKKAGDRVFDVSVQGEKVIEDFDIVKEAGKQDKEIIKTIAGVKAGKSLRLDFTPQKGNVLLSGIEIIMENSADLEKP